MSLPNINEILLRCVSCAGFLTLNEAEDVIRKYSDEESPDVKDLIKQINKKIKPFKQIIKLVSNELTDEQILVFLNIASDDATKAHNFFTSLELEYFRMLIEEIMLSEKRQISGIYAMNLVGKMKSVFTKSSAQKLLGTWHDMGYLEKSGNDYALGVRAIHEFESYLRQNMPDSIEECSLCKHIVFRGGNCPSCGSASHTRCLQQYIQRVPKWPCCKVAYTPDSTQQLSQSYPTECSIQSEQYEDNQIEESQNNSSIDDTQQCSIEDESSQLSVPGISQCVTRKRKRAIID